VPPAGRKYTYGRTQQVFVLRGFEWDFDFQHNQISDKQLTASVAGNGVDICPMVKLRVEGSNGTWACVCVCVCVCVRARPRASSEYC
jgi:hypothetical protein